MQITSLDKPVSLKQNEPVLFILGGSQLLIYLYNNQKHVFHITTATNGFGEEHSSYQTPRGWHYIRAMIGKNKPTGTFFHGRRATQSASSITGRILWLCGMQTSNHNPKNHSMLRYIYIHGTNHRFLKTPVSQGCINMQNKDIAALALMLPHYCKVYIDPEE